MDRNTLPQLTPPAARVVIHAEREFGDREIVRGSLLHWLHGWFSVGSKHAARAPLSVRIDDLNGSRALVLDGAGPLVYADLPSGTYLVTAQFGKVRRGYTVVLEPGSSVDLYLPGASESAIFGHMSPIT